MRRVRIFYVSQNRIIKYFETSVDYENGEQSVAFPLSEDAFVIGCYWESEPNENEDLTGWQDCGYTPSIFERLLTDPYTTHNTIGDVINHLQPYMFRELSSTIFVSV